MDILKKKNESKYLVFDSTAENKEVLGKYTELWDEIKNEIETRSGGKKGKYGKDIMKIKFDTDDNLRQMSLSQMKIKNRPDYLFNGNLIVNIKDFDSSLLKICKLSYKGVLVLIFSTLNTSLQKLLIILMMINIMFISSLMKQMGTLKKTMELNIQFLLLKKTSKKYKKLGEETERQIEVINDDKPIE